MTDMFPARSVHVPSLPGILPCELSLAIERRLDQADAQIKFVSTAKRSRTICASPRTMACVHPISAGNAPQVSSYLASTALTSDIAKRWPFAAV